MTRTAARSSPTARGTSLTPTAAGRGTDRENSEGRMKRIAGSPGQRPKPTILQYFGTLTLAGREGSDRITKITNSIEIRLVDWGDGLRRVDIRRYVDTRKYTGPT